MFNAALSFSGKAVSGVGTLLGGLIITLIEFPTGLAAAEVPPGAILRLGIVVGVVVPLLYLFPISLITRYRITEEVHDEIKAELDARRRAETGATPHEPPT
jgi:Na+/melibiose symporter-like transporter